MFSSLALRTSDPSRLRRGGWRRRAFLAGVVTAAVGGCTLLAWLLHRKVDLAVLILLYQVTVVLVAFRWGRYASALATLLGILAFDYFFETPAFSLAVANWQTLLVFSLLLAVAQLVAGLVARLRAKAEEAESHARDTAVLHTFNLDLQGASTTPEILAAAESHLRQALGRPVRAAQGPDGQVLLGEDPSESPSDQALLRACSVQVGIALERARLREESEAARLEVEVERSRSALLSSVSHDLRTPLATINGAACSLSMEAASLTEETQRDLVGLILAESERMARMVDNLLNLTRLEGGPSRLRMEWQSLEEITGAVLARLERKVGRGRVEVELPEDLPLLELDELLVELLLMNLLENAFRHGGGCSVALRAIVQPEWVELRVEDRGPGIPEAERDQVFEKFFKGAGAAREGAGLGLAISKAILRAHRGWIRAEEGPEGGACVRFAFPRTPPPTGPGEDA